MSGENLYDRLSPDRVTVVRAKNGREYHLAHLLRPLDDARFFQLARETHEALKGATRLSTKVIEPRLALWLDLVESVEGYRPREDWKDSVYYMDRLDAINTLLAVDTAERDPLQGHVAMDDEQPSEVKLRVIQSGALVDVAFRFRGESIDHMDRFLVLHQNVMQTLSVLWPQRYVAQAERLRNLGREVLIDCDGYIGEPPAWHLAIATKVYFSSRVSSHITVGN